MFNGLMSDADYWGHQHYLVEDGHPESKRLELKGAASSEKLYARKANFTLGVFNSVDLRGYFGGCDFSNAKFYYCNFSNSTFYNCNFEGAEFHYCEMDLTSFRKCNLEDCLLNSDIRTVEFKNSYGNNSSFISRVLYNSYGEALWFGATQHRVYIGCSDWKTYFFAENHRTIIACRPYYMEYYKKYKNEILNLLAYKGWIDEPSWASKLMDLLPMIPVRI
jgi:hypothetical protein